MALLLEFRDCSALMTAALMRKHEERHVEAERLLTAMARGDARTGRSAVEPTSCPPKALLPRTVG